MMVLIRIKKKEVKARCTVPHFLGQVHPRLIISGFRTARCSWWKLTLKRQTLLTLMGGYILPEVPPSSDCAAVSLQIGEVTAREGVFD